MIVFMYEDYLHYLIPLFVILHIFVSILKLLLNPSKWILDLYIFSILMSWEN